MGENRKKQQTQRNHWVRAVRVGAVSASLLLCPTVLAAAQQEEASVSSVAHSEATHWDEEIIESATKGEEGVSEASLEAVQLIDAVSASADDETVTVEKETTIVPMGEEVLLTDSLYVDQTEQIDGQDGQRVVTYRTVYRQGHVHSREQIAVTEQPARNRMIKKGTKPRVLRSDATYEVMLEVLRHGVRYVDDPNLSIGTEEIAVHGYDGIARNVYAQKTRTLVATRATQQAANTIVRRGTGHIVRHKIATDEGAHQDDNDGQKMATHRTTVLYHNGTAKRVDDTAVPQTAPKVTDIAADAPLLGDLTPDPAPNVPQPPTSSEVPNQSSVPQPPAEPETPHVPAEPSAPIVSEEPPAAPKTPHQPPVSNLEEPSNPPVSGAEEPSAPQPPAEPETPHQPPASSPEGNVTSPESPRKEEADSALPPLNPQRNKQLSETKIELKNVRSAFLYTIQNNRPQRVLSLQSPNGVYYIKAILADGRTMWLDVARITEEADGYRAHAALADMVQLADDATYQNGYAVTVPKASASQDAAVITSFADLVAAIQKNSSGTFRIGSNLSADEVVLPEGQHSYIMTPFSGTLTADPQQKVTIFDLQKPLFNHLLNATIRHLRIQDSHVRATSDSQVGLLAKVADERTRISDVHAHGSVTGHDEIGGLIGRLDTQAQVHDSSFAGYLSAEKIVGGIAGVATRGATVSRAAADVTIASMSRQELVRIGGLIGSMGEHASLEHSMARGTIYNNSVATAVGGAVGHVAVAHDTTDRGRIANVLSTVRVHHGDAFIGNASEVTGKTLHQLLVPSVDDTHTAVSVQRVDATAVQAFQAAFKTQASRTHSAQATAYRHIFGYRDSRQKAYHNMEQLLPFFDRETIVAQANQLPDTDAFVMKTIASVSALNNQQPVTQLYGQTQTINQLRITYTDGTQDTLVLEQPQQFKQTGIYTYRIADKGVLFQPNRFAVNHRATVAALVQTLQAKNFGPELFNQQDITKNHYDQRAGSGIPVQEISKQEKVQKTYLEMRFDQVKETLAPLLHRLIEEDAVYTSDAPIVQAKWQQKPEAVLVGLTYLDRWYPFGNLKEQLLFDLPAAAAHRSGSGLDLVLAIGRETTDALDARLTAVTYSQVVAPFTEKWTVAQLLHDQAQQEAGGHTSIDTWLKQVATAYLVTTKEDDATGRNLIFDRLIKPQNTHMILPLLSGKSPNVYGIFTSDSAVFGIMDTYLEHRGEAEYARVKELIRTSGASIQRFFDLLRRIIKPEAAARLQDTNLLVFDTYADRWRGWKNKQDDVIKSFAGPVGRWIPRNNRDGAYAQGENVHFVGNKVLSESGLSTLTHEHTHNIDNKILFNNYGRRGNHGAENYALGLFQSVATGSTTHGFNFVYEKPKNQYNWYYNASPERFRSAEDLQTYYRGVFDVLYTLDHAEADAILRQGAHYIEQNYRKLEPLAVRNSYHKQDQVTYLGTLGAVQTIDDLVDQGVVAAGNAGRDRLSQGSVYGHNGYYTVDLFDAQYGILENDKGHSGGFTLRRVAFELLAEKGYHEGMIPYITNQYFAEFLQEKRSGETLSDSYILHKIFPENEYSSFNDFRKKMFARRKAAADRIKPISIQWWDASESRYQTAHLSDYNSIRQLFVTVLERNPYNRFAMTNLKKQIFKEYLDRTDEFRTSIYRD